MGVEAWFVTPSANAPNGWQEGQSPSSVNDGARDILASVRNWYNDAGWIEYGAGDGAYTATGVSAEQFKIVSADVSAAYHAGRRVRITGNTTGTVYAYIKAASFGGDTAVTVTARSGDIKLEDLRVYLSVVPALNTNMPRFWGASEGEAAVQGDLASTGFIGGLGVYGYTDSGSIVRYGRVRVAIADRSAASPDGQISLSVLRAGVEVDGAVVTADGVLVGAPDGLQQGYGTLNCQGLFVNGMAVGGVVPDATTSIKGIVRLASSGETAARSLATVAVTPASIPTATTAQAGWTTLATQAQASAGTSTTTAVPPSTLAAAIAALMPSPSAVPDATTSVKGIVELATQGEANAGSDTTRAVTPSSLGGAIAALAPLATTSQSGIVELATGAEMLAGTDTVRAVSPGVLAAFKTLNGSSGHYILPGNFQFAWGNIPNAGGGGGSDTFSNSFTTVYGLTVGTTTAGANFATCTAISTTGISVDKFTDAGVQNSGAIFYLVWGIT